MICADVEGVAMYRFNGAARVRARRCRVAGPHDHMVDASTGPRAFARGDVGVRLAAGSGALLQRGRARSRAEIALELNPESVGNLLQRGRARSRAEMSWTGRTT